MTTDPSSWGDDRAVAAFTFDLDADEIWRLKAERDEAWNTPPQLSRGRFGPEVAVPRILDLFERYDLPCTFFVPAVVAERWPDVIRDIHEAGHEIGHHGYRHTDPVQELDDGRTEFEAAMDTFEDIIGETPVGYRNPAGSFTERTRELLAEHDVRYDSSMKDDDAPYMLDEERDIVELPNSYYLDDWVYFGFNMYPQMPYQSGITPTGPVFESWLDEFRGLYERGRMFMLMMHPQAIGRAGRIDALEGLIQEVLATGDTRVATCSEIADAWRDADR
jgi:peptidoglycan/xylan/chitin deacetylase (PgdA/CDA1 family)